MSAPSRAAGADQSRSATSPTSRGRVSRGASRPFQPRARGQATPSSITNPKAAGLLQGLQAGTTARRGSDNAIAHGARGRGTFVRGAPTAPRGHTTNGTRTSNASKPASGVPIALTGPASTTDFMSKATARFETLKRRREAERADAIKNGFLADPDKKTTLDNAITPVGTCTEMCPAFERVERIVQRMVDKSEKAREDNSKFDEDRMVKRFRRSAAGYDEQLPSDIRTPVTLKRTLDYLLGDIVGGGERLASIHKFVWDRTRGIRNDFSIQQVTREEDVRIAVECLERIARFHILSLHQLSNPHHLVGEQFDAHQEREQLNNTLLSLMYYYDDNRHLLDLPNEAEFRAYCVLFELQSQHPDIEDRMQSWPKAVLEDGRVKTAFRLYAAAGNTIFDQGPLKPLTTFSLAQGNTGSFWSILSSKQVSYLMACVAEIYFGQVRYMALQALWTAATSAPAGTRAKNQDWTHEELANVLGFDADEQAAEFCKEFGLKISTRDDDVQYLDATMNKTLDKSLIPTKQVFSHEIVEAKRFRRTLTAVVNGKTVPQAVREGLVEMDESQHEVTEEEDLHDDGESLFLPERQPATANPFARPTEQADVNPFAKSAERPTSNPFAKAAAPAFAPGMFQQPLEASANPFTGFGPPKPSSSTPEQAESNPFAKAGSLFPNTGPPKVDSPTTAAKSANAFSNSNDNGLSFIPQSTPPKPVSQPFVFSGGGLNTSTTAAPIINAPAPNNSFSFAPFTSQPTPISIPPSQPPAFSWPKPNENTQNNGDPRLEPDFHPVSTPQALGPITFPPGMVSGNKHWQPASPTLKNPQLPSASLTPLPRTPAQHLKNARSAGPVSFSLAPNGTLAAFDEPGRTWPRRFPESVMPQVAIGGQNFPPSPLGRPGGASQNPILLDSIETDTNATPTITPPATQPAAASQHQPLPNPPGCVTQSSAPNQTPLQRFAPRAGYQWSDPTVPGYRKLTPPQAPAPKPKLFRTAASRQDIVDSLANVAMRQDQGGIMDEFVKFLAPGIIDQAILQYNVETHQQNSKTIRDDYLRTKYVKRIKKAYSLRKVRKAKSAIVRHREWRAEGYAEMERLHAVKEKRRSRAAAELEEITRAIKESEDVRAQMEANERREERDRARKEEETARKEKEDAAQAAKPSQVAGRKRKSTSPKESDEPRLDLAGRPYTPRHKRTRTVTEVDNDQDHDMGWERHHVRYNHAPQRPFSRSLFSRSMSNYNIPRASESRLPASRETTKTDYFRLKARGINPDTPMVPLTAKQVEQRRKQAEVDSAHRAAEPKPWYRESSLKRSSRSLRLWDSDMPSPAKPVPKPLPKPLPKPVVENPEVTDESIRDLLAQVKKHKEEETADVEWYKARNAELAQLDDPVEESPEVHQTIERRDSCRTSSSSLMRSSNGYEFLPVETKPGHTMSRTEQRIRRTGAHGLATAPIGGTPDYLKSPVDSHRGVDMRNDESHASPMPKSALNGKGKERADQEEDQDQSEDDELYVSGHSFAQFGLPAPAPRNGLDLDDTEELHQQRLASDNLHQEDAQSSEGNYDAGNPEEEDYDEEDYNNGNEINFEKFDDECTDDGDHAGPSRRGPYLSATPDAGGHASRGASSGAGTSVEDAIDLSD